jgi:hypothetical protein
MSVLLKIDAPLAEQFAITLESLPDGFQYILKQLPKGFWWPP